MQWMFRHSKKLQQCKESPLNQLKKCKRKTYESNDIARTTTQTLLLFSSLPKSLLCTNNNYIRNNWRLSPTVVIRLPLSFISMDHSQNMLYVQWSQSFPDFKLQIYNFSEGIILYMENILSSTVEMGASLHTEHGRHKSLEAFWQHTHCKCEILYCILL